MYASVNASRVTRLAFTWAMFGLWVADVDLADDSSIDTRVTLSVANAKYVGAVVRQTAFAGKRTARLVGGANGWSKTVARRTYQFGTVPVQLVLGDAAAEVGESIAPVSGTLGPDFVREECPASRVLRLIAGHKWWIDETGVTHVGERDATTVTSDFLVASYDGARGQLSIATEDIASWKPGATFTNKLLGAPLTASSVSLYMGDDAKLRVEVLAQ